MRIITEKSISAFLANRPFKNQNMEVTLPGFGLAYLRLHGNAIARKDINTGTIEISTAGWNTRTTLARLNGLPGVNVRIKSGCLSLNGRPWDGSWTAIRTLEVV